MHHVLLRLDISRLQSGGAYAEIEWAETMTWSKSAGNALTYATKLTPMLQVLQQLNKFMFSKQKGYTETKYTETMTCSKLAANARELSNQYNNNASCAAEFEQVKPQTATMTSSKSVTSATTAR